MVKTHEALAELSNSVTPAKAGVQKLLKNLDSGFRRNDAQGLLQEARMLTRSKKAMSVRLSSTGFGFFSSSLRVTSA